MDETVKRKFATYPEEIKHKLLQLRAVVFEVAEQQDLGVITESLKWGEPSYVAHKGSAVRMDWKSKAPDLLSLYFNCQTSLVETFKEIYRDTLQFSGNREIVLPLSEPLPIEQLKACMSMSLRYHAIKHLPLLGA